MKGAVAWKLSGLCLLLIPLLASCGLIVALSSGWLSDDCQPQGVLFSEAALQGIYSGSVENYLPDEADAALTLVLEPSYVNEGEYAVSGTFDLGAEEPLLVEGRVTGGCRYEYKPASTLDVQSTRPSGQGLEAEARTARGETRWHLRVSDYDGWVGPASIEGTLEDAA